MDIDPQLLARFQLGLAIGFLWITTLSFFPGKPLGIAYGSIIDEPETLFEATEVTTLPATTTTTVDDDTTTTNKCTTNQDNHQTTTKEPFSPEQLEKMRQKMGLSQDEWQNAIRASQSPHCVKTGSSILQTPMYKMLNRFVYIIAFAVLFHVLNRDYNNYASWTFARYFPKEAGTLGMFVPRAIEK